MENQKILLIAVLLPLAVFFNPAMAQQPNGQKGVVCTSYDQCSNVEIGYLVSPNPVRDVLYIDLKSDEEATIILDLYDASGKRLNGFGQKVIVLGRVSTKMRIGHLPEGYYFLHIMDITRQTLENIRFQKD